MRQREATGGNERQREATGGNSTQPKMGGRWKAEGGKSQRERSKGNQEGKVPGGNGSRWHLYVFYWPHENDLLLKQLVELIKAATKERHGEATPCNQKWEAEAGNHKGKLVREIKNERQWEATRSNGRQREAIPRKGLGREAIKERRWEATGGNRRQRRATEYGKPKKEATERS